ncbi:hypothetical protein N7462_004320 [Penicillium macrosclerotiorum]|uniref:uncharacterized protein n=1 Tax=Penicillium macrosclerotiorum TaxID=303699 RepID=UPI0025494F17|nr:uncharacterized protein N7462_004320 [Penicillium macrosclerotiorum]KAJ5689928.1 hypothetical protein N7462_004320 [Penicillium macrosclerotiorum]
MGHPAILQETFGLESKTNPDSRASVHSTEDGSPHPALDSTFQLFESEPSPEEQQWRPGVRDWLVFISIVILAMMDSFDATVLIPALPELANTFDEPLASTLWVNTAYLIMSVASQLFFTMMCEVFSHGPVWIVAVVFTTIGTGVCSGSMSLVELVIGRVVQGIGGGGAMALCFVIMAESAPECIHSRYSCYILLTRLIGSIIGPVVGGLFVDHASWTWAFYFNFIFCALGLMAIPFAVDLRVSKNIPLRKLRILDWSGASMAFLGPSSAIVGLSWGGILHKWTEWQTLMPIAVGAAALVALVFYESKWALHPQFGPRVFRSRATAMTYIGCFCHGFVVFCQMQYFTFYFISAKYFSTTISGLALLALTGLALTPAAVVGVVLARESQCSRWIISGGWVLTILASGCSVLLISTTPTVGWVFIFFSAGLGHGLLLSSYNIRIHSVPTDDGVSLPLKPITMSNYMRAWGMAVAVPVGGVVFLNILGNQFQSLGLRRDLINTARGYVVLMDQVAMPDGQREAIQGASSMALRVVWEIITGVGAIGGISSIFLWTKKQ